MPALPTTYTCSYQVTLPDSDQSITRHTRVLTGADPTTQSVLCDPDGHCKNDNESRFDFSDSRVSHLVGSESLNLTCSNMQMTADDMNKNARPGWTRTGVDSFVEEGNFNSVGECAAKIRDDGDVFGNENEKATLVGFRKANHPQDALKNTCFVFTTPVDDSEGGLDLASTFHWRLPSDELHETVCANGLDPYTGCTSHGKLPCLDGEVRVAGHCTSLKEKTEMRDSMNYFVLEKDENGRAKPEKLRTTPVHKIGSVPTSIEFGMEITEERDSQGQWSGLFTVSDMDKCTWGNKGSNLASFVLRRVGDHKYQFFDILDQYHPEDDTENKAVRVDNHFFGVDSQGRDMNLGKGKYIVKRTVFGDTFRTEIRNADNPEDVKVLEKQLDEDAKTLMRMDRDNEKKFDAEKMHLCAYESNIGVKLTDVKLDAHKKMGSLSIAPMKRAGGDDHTFSSVEECAAHVKSHPEEYPGAKAVFIRTQKHGQESERGRCDVYDRLAGFSPDASGSHETMCLNGEEYC